MSFSFNCYGDHRDLHSFPTRRSSDLPSTPSPASPPASSAACGSASGTTGASTRPDRKSTRLNSSHSQISYAVFCLKKKIEGYEAAIERAEIDLAVPGGAAAVDYI